MRYNRLGSSDLTVSRICLGSHNFGWWLDKAQCRRLLDVFLDLGGNFIDTADVYPYFGEGMGGAVSEEIIGEWLTLRRLRPSVIVGTKVCCRTGPGPDGRGLSRAHITAAVEASLRRLRCDYIDLYQAHFDDPGADMEETMQAFADLVGKGLVRCVGCSNFAASRIEQANGTGALQGNSKYISLQLKYNLIDCRDTDPEIWQVCQKQHLGLLAYNPLAKGFLTGRYRRGAPLPESIRASTVWSDYASETNWGVIDALQSAAGESSMSPAQAALAWVLGHPFMAAAIIGCSTPDQLLELAHSADLVLNDLSVSLLDTVASEFAPKPHDSRPMVS